MDSGLSRLSQKVPAVALAGAWCLILASCASTGSQSPGQVGVTPTGDSAAAGAPVYPAVHDLPPPRPNSVLTDDEKRRIEAELAAMREQQAKRAAASGNAQ
jgi:hypothetical protein